MAELSKKYNLQAMQQYNFDNIDFDIDFGSISQKDHDQAVKEAELAEKEEK